MRIFDLSSPHFDDSVYVAPTAVVIGRVHLESDSSVWFGSVVRADIERISIGARTNIQDLSLLHADPGFPIELGDEVTIGHGAIVHGCRVQDRVLIGMRATLLNGCRVESGSIVGAGALVTEGTVIPAGSLAVGVPARVVRSLTPEEIARIPITAGHYVDVARCYRADFAG